MESLIKSFYEAFAKKEAETMVSFYHNDVTFNDPAFGTLQGEHAKNMWRMLCASQKDKEFKISHYGIKKQDEVTYAQWEAIYNFSKTGRKVHNKISARFTFKDNKIYTHEDVFNLHNWAKQALGFKGWLIGGTNFFKSKLQKQTNQLLTNYESSMT